MLLSSKKCESYLCLSLRRLHQLLFVSHFFRYAEHYINQTMDEINLLVKNGKDIPDRLSFMGHLISSKDLSPNDTTVLTLSLLLDTLSTVSTKALIYSTSFSNWGSLFNQSLLFVLTDCTNGTLLLIQPGSSSRNSTKGLLRN